MEIRGEYRIAATRIRVFEALNNPTVLQACIPGCESLEKTSDTELKAKVRMRIGPVSASFAGKVTLSDLDPPNGYKITGEGQGGAAGFAKGGAVVTLRQDCGDTILNYRVDAQVGGKIAQVGARLIDGTARKLADEFFGKFVATVSQQLGETSRVEAIPSVATVPSDEAISLPEKPQTKVRHQLGWPPIAITAGAIAMLAIIYFLSK